MLGVSEAQHTLISFSSPGKNIRKEWNQTGVQNWSTATGKPLTREGSSVP